MVIIQHSRSPLHSVEREKKKKQAAVPSPYHYYWYHTPCQNPVSSTIKRLLLLRVCTSNRFWNVAHFFLPSHRLETSTVSKHCNMHLCMRCDRASFWLQFPSHKRTECRFVHFTWRTQCECVCVSVRNWTEWETEKIKKKWRHYAAIENKCSR